MLKPDCLVYTVPEAANILGLTRNSAYAAAKSGALPTLKFGKLLRVPKTAVDAIRDGAPYAIPHADKKPVGRPRKFTDNRISLSFRLTTKMYKVLTARREESGRSLSEEIEMILEKAFFPMDAEVAARVRDEVRAPAIHPLKVAPPAVSSLREFLPKLAPVLDLTECMLHERMRELVRHKLLPVRSGRGPGSGTPMDYDTVSMLIAAYVMTDNIRDIRNINDEAFSGVAQGVKAALSDPVEFTHIRNESAPIKCTIILHEHAIRTIRDLVERQLSDEG